MTTAALSSTSRWEAFKMMTLIVGGASSGKSEFAESIILSCRLYPRIYIATMEPFGAEAATRIERHRQMRAQKQFQTLECYTGLESVTIPQGAAVLLECLGNLSANELYSPAGSGCRAFEAVLAGIKKLKARCGHLVVVSNEVHSGGTAYEGDTLRYLELLGALNCALAECSDEVYEIVSGIPVKLKGGTKDASVL